MKYFRKYYFNTWLIKFDVCCFYFIATIQKSLPFIVSSITISTSFTVARVFRHMLGLELISINHGDKSSPSMKSAPYNSTALWKKIKLFNCFVLFFGREYKTTNSAEDLVENSYLSTFNEFLATKQWAQQSFLNTWDNTCFPHITVTHIPVKKKI